MDEKHWPQVNVWGSESDGARPALFLHYIEHERFTI